jgi:hypothetical protein
MERAQGSSGRKSLHRLCVLPTDINYSYELLKPLRLKIS